MKLPSLSYSLKHPRSSALLFLLYFSQCLPDKYYLRILYRVRMGKSLNLNNPQTFGEKLQWLKLYDRNPDYIKMVDKIAVKEYVGSIIGEEYIIPTLGIWSRAEDIEWDSLPEKFVLKCNHDSGGLVICRDKSKLNKEEAIRKLNNSLNTDFYKGGREWPYKNVPRRIFAEKYIEPKVGVIDLPDYKWYCFGGVPKFCQVIQDRNTKETIDFFDADWNHQEFVGLSLEAENAINQPVVPKYLDLHKKIAGKLSKDIPFARIDLYETENNLYFGEITLYPSTGLGKFRPEKYNIILGQMLNLNIVRKE